MSDEDVPIDLNVENTSSNDASSTSSTCSTTSGGALNAIKLNVVLTNKGLQIYGTWSKEKLLKLLTKRLRQCVHAKSSNIRRISQDVANNKRLQLTVYSGLYSNRVLKQLQSNGMSMHSILKAMKLGLISLNHTEILYFKDFKIEQFVLEFRDMWTKTFSDELILNLRPTGLSEMQCWNIIVYGVVLQDQCILRHLVLSGIDVSGISNWQSPVNTASPKIIDFLRHIGIQENDVQIVQHYGIDEETEQMLIDLGLNEMEERSSNMEEIICECSLTILEPVCNRLETICKTSNSKSTSDTADITHHLELCGCQCHVLDQNKTATDKKALRIDYLRQNVLVPLTWAMARTLQYKPSDPVHYMAYQLLCWIHQNVSQKDKECFYQAFALSTMVMDRKLIVKKRLEKEEQIRIHNALAMENIPCDMCKVHQELHRIKKQCWKCVRRPLSTHESCEFSRECSSCKINVSDKSDDYSSRLTLERTINNLDYCQDTL